MTSIEECTLAMLSLESERADTDLVALVETYAALLFRVAHSILRSKPEAEDVVQDVFVRVLQHRGTLPVVREMRVWLVRIAWNLAIDRRRRIKPQQFDESFADGLVASTIPADQSMDERQRMKIVLLEMERLPKGERHALLLSAVEELGTPEIAAVLGRSESAVRALLFRARARLRERLARGGTR
ncbi:RNA polymerase sigma factor [Granulicella arctica]|uniref:RNA polymerase sigma factor n=1 Tax=Granulicella arctica TaxID=940613 RepID=UPI0021E02E59|nr:sigma-70 family RNA polymerase sigma factor [Granulicella arctica]